MEKIISIRNINKAFQTNKSSVLACHNVSFDIYKGEFISIVGESGCGKSTLMKIITSLESKTSGEVVYNGVDITELKGKHLRTSRRNIQMLFQDTTTSLNPKMKVLDIICEPLINFKLISKKEKIKFATEFLEKVGLNQSFLNRYPKEMSGGQRQRVGLARALTLNPEVLILDEATSALDIITRDKIIDLIKDIHAKTNLTVLFVCHDLNLVSKISDRVVTMHNGEIVADKSVQRPLMLAI
ncbi:ABC transporter ATP-binding protein [Candidatus Epulonipiscium viviparus]|uniref:ABC transporter ATP-binding protein n=1 Tax=Candidatus Epulonipiscium viviparus TaxID=420336 RepID=UPI00273805AE|nr:dipeptide/oligopeptide/nickel ABC transporter ATP-binding protein [Candidatus Epulopiscium viviparus]